MDRSFKRACGTAHHVHRTTALFRNVPLSNQMARWSLAASSAALLRDQDLSPLEQFSQIISLLYEAAGEPQNWKLCLEAIRRQIGGNYASLIVRQHNADCGGLVVSACGDRRDMVTADSGGSLSPFSGLTPGQVATISDFMPETDWRKSDYYNASCKPQQVFHAMAADVATSDGCLYGLRITRPQGAPDFGPQERAFLAMLLPHVQRVLNLHLGIHQDRQVISLYSRSLAQLMVAVIVLDQSGVVIETNPSANRLLKAEDGLMIRDGKLRACYGIDNRKLQRLIGSTLMHSKVSRLSRTEGLCISRQSGELNWGVVVQSIAANEWTDDKPRPCVAVFVRDTESQASPPVRLVRQLFQLTPAETSLSIHLANGLSLDEAAEALNTRYNTARSHLRSIFAKLNVRSQTELVRVFLNSVACLGNR